MIGPRQFGATKRSGAYGPLALGRSGNEMWELLLDDLAGERLCGQPLHRSLDLVGREEEGAVGVTAVLVGTLAVVHCFAALVPLLLAGIAPPVSVRH